MNFTNHLSTATITADSREALRNYNDFRATLGHGKVSHGKAIMTQPTDNLKLAKTARPVFGLSLAPHRDVEHIMGAEISAVQGFNLCPWSTPACRASCVSYAGNGEYPKVQRLRAVKTAFAVVAPGDFLSLLLADIDRAADKAPNGMMRLNTFSDIAWERFLPAEVFTRLAAYDYSKGGIRRFRAAREVGYRIVLSVSERTNLSAMDSWLAEGATAAVVFGTKRGEALPETFRGHRVIDGDASDDRLADPTGVVVGLRAKGRLNYRGNTESRCFIRG